MSPLLSPLTIFVFFIIIDLITTAYSTTFTFTNKCDTTVWPGTLTNAGNAPLNLTGFELQTAQTRSFQAPTGWSGRFWARTGCNFDSAGLGSCSTGDCGSGQIECNGAGAEPPATLAEFTLAGPTSGLDFYDVSLVDGYNLPMVVESGSSGCGSTGCLVDLNQRCPAELRVGDGETKACRSACEAFGKPEFCCSGEYGSPATCRPTFYSEMFKSACPKSYSYAYDDASSTFTCSGGDYTLTFCPDSTPSQKSTMSYSSDNYPPTITTEGGGGGGGEGGKGEMLEDESWLASLAIGDASPSTMITSFLHHFSFLVATTIGCNILLILEAL